MKKIIFYTEYSYIVGMMLLAFGTALTVYGGLGISMVVAPAYILHLYLSKFVPFFSFGMAEYILQAIVLLIMMLILKKVKFRYLLSFVSALLYGIFLDASMLLVSHFPSGEVIQIIVYAVGALICCIAIALLFFSYLPPEAYEMFVKEIALMLKKPIHKIKTVYDFGSLAVAFLLSIIFFADVRGIGIGTVICAFAYGFFIRIFQIALNKHFRFEDRLNLRNYFEEREN